MVLAMARARTTRHSNEHANHPEQECDMLPDREQRQRIEDARDWRDRHVRRRYVEPSFANAVSVAASRTGSTANIAATTTSSETTIPPHGIPRRYQAVRAAAE